MLCYAVIDTNILVSSLLSKRNDSATVQVIGRVITGDIIPLYSNLLCQ
jgi:predicted nucleic acid-binding protein